MEKINKRMAAAKIKKMHRKFGNIKTFLDFLYQEMVSLPSGLLTQCKDNISS